MSFAEDRTRCPENKPWGIPGGKRSSHGKIWSFQWEILGKCGEHIGKMWKTCGETCSENDLQMVRAASFSVCFCFGLDDFGTSVNTIDQVQFSFPQPAIRRKKTFSIPKFTRGFLKTWVHFLPH